MIEIAVGPNVFSQELFTTLVLSWHGLLAFVAVAISVVLVGRWAPLRGVDPDAVYSIAVWVIIGGIIGARLVHVVDNWVCTSPEGLCYSRDPGLVFAVWSGGIGLWGGVLGGLAAGVAACVIMKQPIGVIADLAAPAALIGQTIGRLGDIVNGEHCAKATDSFIGFFWTHPDTLAAPQYCANGYISPEGVGSASHPVILYEILWNTLSLAVIWRLRGRLKPDGMLFALYLALYSLGRFFITFLREDRVWALGMQEAHFIALGVLAVTVPLLIAKAKPVARVAMEGVPIKWGTRAQRRRRQR